MKFIQGELAATNDPNLVQYIAQDQNAKIIFIGDPAGYNQQVLSMHLIVAGPLAPDYTVMEADVNGNQSEFAQKYSLYLQSEPAKMYFATIIAALMLGKNILLFFPPEGAGLKYPDYLLQYILSVYGIQTRTDNVQFAYNDQYTPQNVAFLYNYNLVDPQTYLKYAGESFVNMIPKLAYDIRIPTRSPMDFKSPQMIEYINAYRVNILNTGQHLIKPFTREVVSYASGN